MPDSPPGRFFTDPIARISIRGVRQFLPKKLAQGGLIRYAAKLILDLF
jgi:hypothetical protein